MWAPTRGFRLGTQAADEVHAHPGGLGLCAQAAGLLIRECTHPRFQLWSPSPLILVRANQASGVFWGS